MKKLSTEQVIEDFRKVHGDRYTYENMKYERSSEKVIITCKEHGDFLQTPHKHKQGKGCPKCSKNYRYSSDEIIVECIKIHKDRYLYDKVRYKNAHEPIIITCKEHGDFLQTTNNHLKGKGCPKCGIKYRNYENNSYCDRNYFKDKKTTLYKIYLPDYDLYKVGLTTLTLKRRFSADNIEYKIISEKIFEDGAIAWDEEQRLLNETKEFKYEGENILKAGNTELRTKGFNYVT